MPVMPPTRSDRLFDLVAAAVPGGAAAYSAARLAPLAEWSSAFAAPVSGLIIFAIGMWVMRASSQPGITAMSATHPKVAAFPTELLLETMWEEAVASDAVLLQPVEAQAEALAELLLDDPLPTAEADSRVVRLFAAQPSPGELVGRIERHLGRSPQVRSCEPADATDSLRRALDELRQSLRQA